MTPGLYFFANEFAPRVEISHCIASAVRNRVSVMNNEQVAVAMCLAIASLSMNPLESCGDDPVTLRSFPNVRDLETTLENALMALRHA